MNKKTLQNITWQPRGLPWQFSSPKPDAITIGNRVHYNPALANRSEEFWTELVAHESRHVFQYKEEGFVGFLSQYLGEYSKNQSSGLTNYSAYRSISFEKQAFDIGSMMTNFFSNQKNNTDFFNILHDNSLSDSQKSNQLEVLGIEKIAIPQLESFKGYFESILNKGNQDIMNVLIQAIDNSIQEHQKRANEIRNK